MEEASLQLEKQSHYTEQNRKEEKDSAGELPVSGLKCFQS